MFEIINFLSKNDPILAKVIRRVPPFKTQKADNYFESLSESIVSQQLSVKASDTIWSRFTALLSEERVVPEEVLKLSDQKIREAGVSRPKIAYIKDLAVKTIGSGIIFEHFEIMADEEIINELIKVKGIGRWTAEMFLIFAMDRPDVFSYGDLGLRRAIERLYGLGHEPTMEEAERISEKWRPYRSTACRYLWKSLELG